MNMNGGILQVLLVAAKDFKDNVLLGNNHWIINQWLDVKYLINYHHVYIYLFLIFI